MIKNLIEMNKNIYLVLHDFTSVGDAALNYAVNLSSKRHSPGKAWKAATQSEQRSTN